MWERTHMWDTVRSRPSAPWKRALTRTWPELWENTISVVCKPPTVYGILLKQPTRNKTATEEERWKGESFTWFLTLTKSVLPCCYLFFAIRERWTWVFARNHRADPTWLLPPQHLGAHVIQGLALLLGQCGDAQLVKHEDSGRAMTGYQQH